MNRHHQSDELIDRGILEFASSRRERIAQAPAWSNASTSRAEGGSYNGAMLTPIDQCSHHSFIRSHLIRITETLMTLSRHPPSMSLHVDSHAEQNPNLYSTPPCASHSTSYVNQTFPSTTNDFYVMPRQENPLLDDGLVYSFDEHRPSTTLHSSERPQLYAVPPTFAKNFVLESNLSFDDSQDTASISLDAVPDLTAEAPLVNDTSYAYSELPPVPPPLNMVGVRICFTFDQSRTMH